MPQTIKSHAEERMDKAIVAFKKDLASLRAGRANPSLLDRIQVEYYGAPTPISQLAGITVPDARTLIIQPWDKTSLASIEKAIMKSDIGITPTNDGTVIRIMIPMLTEERRLDLVKMVKKAGEEAKVAIRNIRRDANDECKKREKTDMSEDESRRTQDEIQKITDRYIAEVDKLNATKEKEILDV